MRLKFVMLFMIVTSMMHASQIKIAVAANVSYAIKPLINAFNATHPDTKVEVTMGSSGKLTAQIKHGAPYMLFMSADMRYPKALYHDGLATTQPRVYALGSLALVSRKERDFSKALALLTEKKIEKIAIANPKTAPYGRAAKEALENVSLYSRIKKKFVYGESIAHTLSLTMAAADIGFVAKSALFSPKMRALKEGQHWMSVDEKLYHPIVQGVVMLKGSEANKEIKAFYDFIFTKEAEVILKAYGYSAP